MDKGKCDFQHMYFEDGPDGTDSFIDDDNDDDGDFAERVQAWIERMLKPVNKWAAPFSGTIDFSMTLMGQ